MKTALQAAAGKCSEELVALLLQKGADVNAPARGSYGSTALQGICRYVPKSPAKKEQQLSIINLLVSYGAKVNAAPARHLGRTALQWAAQHGNLEVTMMLLSCEPPADVNAPPCKHPEFPKSRSNALDVAARLGRLDVVKLLLNNDAVSGYPGNSGYDGAIEVAEDKGWLAVADLIRQHATANLRSDTTRISLSQPQRDWHEYGYDDYSDGYTDFDEDDESDEFDDLTSMTGTRTTMNPRNLERDEIQWRRYRFNLRQSNILALNRPHTNQVGSQIWKVTIFSTLKSASATFLQIWEVSMVLKMLVPPPSSTLLQISGGLVSDLSRGGSKNACH